MTVRQEFDIYETVDLSGNDSDSSESFSVEETYWGYIVRSMNATPTSVVVLQAATWIGGIVCFAGAAGLWVLPGATLTAGIAGMKIGLTVFVALLGAILMWYSSRGVEAEIQIDTSLGEVREVVRNRVGKPSLTGRYGFDAIGGVFIDRQNGPSGQNGRAKEVSLVLRYRNTTQKLQVVTGKEQTLFSLRDRIGRDLMLPGTGRAVAAASPA
ncbi:MAG: hypothetical protein JKX69_08265 [Rhodobacteraceae bacterium]|nr:hypothetical protein [Paracoccaceae bacterium]